MEKNRSSKKFFCYRIPRSRLIFDQASLIFAICSLALCAIAFGPRLSAYLVLDPVAYGGSDYGAENAAHAPRPPMTPPMLAPIQPTAFSCLY